MFIHEMTEAECQDVLRRTTVGRLACAHDNQPNVVPINFAFDGRYFYGFTTLGQKVEWMRLNPLVCLEVDEVINHNQWTSIVASGRYEELPDKSEYEKGSGKGSYISSEAGDVVGAGIHFAAASRKSSFSNTDLLSDTNRPFDRTSREL